MRVDFPGFVRVLAHFRPVDDEDEGNRDPKEPEPLNSRMNKLRCEFVSTPPPSETPELSHPRKDLGLNHALSPPIGDPPPPAAPARKRTWEDPPPISPPLSSQLHFSSTTWIEMERSPGLRCCRLEDHRGKRLLLVMGGGGLWGMEGWLGDG